ncbi:MAG: hypothetical protein MZV65_37770 [Chromatiales bacterium]|nr:hypothetical protein [Chromatiales bacterium]
MVEVDADGFLDLGFVLGDDAAEQSEFLFIAYLSSLGLINPALSLTNWRAFSPLSPAAH